MSKRKLLKALKRLKRLPKNKYFFLYAKNKFKNFYLMFTGSTKVARPSTIMIELTNHCNLACTTCPREYDYGKAMDKGTMPLQKAKDIIDEAWPYLDSIGLTGMGETFLYREINEIVDYIKAKNSGIIISVSTSAMIPGFVEKVSGLINKIDTIQISTDGLGEVYESIRKGASFSVLDENIRSLSRLCRGTETDLILNMVVTMKNYFQMPLMVEYAKEAGIKYMDFTLFNLAAVTGVDSSYYEFYKSREFLDVISTLEGVVRNTPEVEVTNRNFSTASGFRKCHFPWTHFYVCWNGEVPPCCAKPFPRQMSFGNVFEKGLMGVLNNESYRQFRSQWYRNDAPAFCDRCHFIGIGAIKTHPS